MSSDNSRFEPAIIPSQRPGKEGGARARNRSERTRALCEAGMGLFLDRGVASATVDQITRKAGVAKGSFYRYFNDKEQLVEALFAPLESALDAAMARCQTALVEAKTAADLNAAYATMAADLMAVMLASPEAVKLYLQECRGPAEGARSPIRRLSDKVVTGAIALTEVARQRQLLKDLPAEVTAVAVVGAAEGMLMHYFEGRASVAPDEATEALIAMVLEGIRRVDQ